MNASSVLPKISSVRNSILDRKQIIGTKLFSNYEQLFSDDCDDNKPLQQSISSQMVNLFDASYGQKNSAQTIKRNAICQTDENIDKLIASTETQTDLTTGDWNTRYNLVSSQQLKELDSHSNSSDFNANNGRKNYLKTNSCVLVYNLNEIKALRDISIAKIDYIDSKLQIDQTCDNGANDDDFIENYSNAYLKKRSELEKLMEDKDTQTSSKNLKCFCCSIM